MTSEPAANETTSESDEGPGCLPAIMAASALIGIVMLVLCAGGTWFLYGKRAEFALRTTRGSLIPAIEQSLLKPEPNPTLS